MIEIGKKYKVSFDTEVQLKDGTIHTVTHKFNFVLMQETERTIWIKTMNEGTTRNSYIKTKSLNEKCKKCKFYSICICLFEMENKRIFCTVKCDKILSFKKTNLKETTKEFINPDKENEAIKNANKK